MHNLELPGTRVLIQNCLDFIICRYVCDGLKCDGWSVKTWPTELNTIPYTGDLEILKWKEKAEHRWEWVYFLISLCFLIAVNVMMQLATFKVPILTFLQWWNVIWNWKPNNYTTLQDCCVRAFYHSNRNEPKTACDNIGFSVVLEIQY